MPAKKAAAAKRARKAPVELTTSQRLGAVVKSARDIKVNRYGETETSYLPHLHKSIYRHKGTAMGYGVKLWPEDLATVKDKAPEALVLEGL